MDVIFNVSLLSKLNCSMIKTAKGFPVVYFHLTFPKNTKPALYLVKNGFIIVKVALGLNQVRWFQFFLKTNYFYLNRNSDVCIPTGLLRKFPILKNCWGG